MRNRPTATLSDVARLAGVSSNTVSRVVHARGPISEATRQKVSKAIADLGYVANSAARSLRGGKTNVVGLVIQDLSNQYFAEIVHGASEAIRSGGFDLMLYTSSNDPVKERERVVTLSSGLSDGLLIVAPHGSRSSLDLAERSRVPVVLINYWNPSTQLARVNADNYLGARQATEYLLELGHRRIGFITGRPDHSSAPERPDGFERFRAFQDALEQEGVLLDRRLVVPGGLHQPQGRAAGHELLEVPDPPTAIFAANDFCAFGVIEAVRERGLRVPDDVSVIGFDDVPMASQVHPPLTTVRHPLHDLGQTAVQRLIQLIRGHTLEHPEVVLPSSLMIRGSSAPPPGKRLPP